ncbi:hypothetical protein [Calothrix sp. CCY 0018]|uniref:hypothetical protein n=1 Tax=Calothrix sp. CCY 0018 TaxID=3103864 RepID=UPI0039C6C324
MTNPSIYWTLVRIDAAGDRQVQSIPSAQTFFDRVFASVTNAGNLSSRDIQSQLLDLYQDTSGLMPSASSSAYRRINAQRTLLCFISWEIDKVCLNLAKQFGATGGFTSRDLLPYVLDDDGRLQPKSSYQCYSLQILNSFDINQSSLSSWTNRKVKQHPALSKFLLECGIYLLSDWAILNDTQPKQLERILSQFHSLTATEIQKYKLLLSSYHTVYRAQRLQQRKTRKTSKCQPPNIEQLQQISDKSSIKADNLMAQLQQLAGYLREYRIHVRGGSLATESIDTADVNNYNSLAAINPTDSEESQTSVSAQ